MAVNRKFLQIAGSTLAKIAALTGENAVKEREILLATDTGTIIVGTGSGNYKQIGSVPSGTTVQRTSATPVEGQLYLDTTEVMLYRGNGTVWEKCVDAIPAVTSPIAGNLVKVKADGTLEDAGHAEADVQLCFHHNTGLSDLQFVGKDPSVIQRSRASDFSAQKLCQCAVTLQMFGVLQTVTDADDAVGIRNIHLRICFIRNKVKMPAADRLGIKADFLVDLLDFRFLSRRSILESAGADGPDLRTQHRDGDDRHDFSADRGFDELDIAGFRIILQFHGIGGAAGIQLDRKARGKVAAVDGTADKDGGRIVFAGEHRKGICIGIGVKVFIASSADMNYAVDAAFLYFFRFFLGKVSEYHSIELVAGGVAEFSQLAAELQSDRGCGFAVMLDVRPHILIIRFLHLRHLLKSRLFPSEVLPASRHRF